MADLPGGRRRIRLAAVIVVLGLAVLVAAVWTDVDARNRSSEERAALAAANFHLARLRHDVATTQAAKAVTSAKRDSLQASIASTTSSWRRPTGHRPTPTRMPSCRESTSTRSRPASGASRTRSVRSRPTTQPGRQGHLGGLGTVLSARRRCRRRARLPVRLPRPRRHPGGRTYFAYATNSVAGNIQIIETSDLTHWTAVGNALQSLPAWAAANYTWAPAVARSAGLPAVLRRRPGRTADECISVAAATSPRGHSRQVDAPLECQKSLGGSIDPFTFIDSSGTTYLLWKSGGPARRRSGPSNSIRPARRSAAAATPRRCWCRTSRGRPGPSRPRHDHLGRPLLPLLLG